MSTSSTTMIPPANPYTTPVFWERLWRTGGIGAVAFFVVAYLIYGKQPPVFASPDALLAFHDGGRARVLIAAIVTATAVLNLMWFAAAIRTTVADAGQDGWGAAATAASAAVGALLILIVTIVAALAGSIVRPGNEVMAGGLNDLAWSAVVASSFPRAMIVMSSAFGLWRARLISNALFAAGVGAIVLVLLGGTTWLNGGFWAPDGLYSRLISPLICLLWILVVGRVLLSLAPATRPAW